MEQLTDRLNYIMRSIVDVRNKLKDIEIFVLDTLPTEVTGLPKPKSKPKVTLANFPSDCYFREETPKTRVVIHHTAGTSVEGALTHWANTIEREGCAYIISRKGEIFEVFNPKYWAFHTGLGEGYDRGSIGIELVNVGPLMRREDDKFYWWPGGAKYAKFGTEYPGPLQNIKHSGSIWRGFGYWEAYTDEQYKSLSSLLEWLCQEFNIPFLRENIIGHSEIRITKTDPSPVFEWSRLGLKK